MQGQAPDGGTPAPTNIGVILVHGVGEQRRFEHLDGQMRFLVRALHGMKLDVKDPVQDVSVDIRPSSAAAFHAEADSWNAGPREAVTVVVRRLVGTNISETRLHVHEVWWADVNEAYSLAKQLRFWLWGLAVWSRPSKLRSRFADKALVGGLPEEVAQKIDALPPTSLPGHRLWDHARLFMVGVYFALLGYSIGTLSFLGNRLLNLKTPKLLQLLTNYVSGVKIYNQRHRFAPGLSWQYEEFLDSVGEPPRVSIRRRMIRAVADVACNDYDRWYVLAHSLGTVAAFNGLMETAYAWPGYLDEERWLRLCERGWNATLPVVPRDEVRVTLPRRPAGLAADAIVNRQAIFAKFAGLLTYGSPLEKFAAIWPSLVPKALEPDVFPAAAPWINAYDPIDPVSGRLEVFAPTAAGACPPVQNLGYNAGWVLLLAHSQYLKRRQNGSDLATAVAKWMLDDDTAPFDRMTEGARLGDRFSDLGQQKGARHWRRSFVAWAWWFGTAAALTAAGGIVLPMLLDAAGAALAAIGHPLAPILAPLAPLTDPIVAAAHCLAAWGETFGKRCALLFELAVALTILTGIGARLFVFRRDDDDTRKRGVDPAAARRRRLGI